MATYPCPVKLYTNIDGCGLKGRDLLPASMGRDLLACSAVVNKDKSETERLRSWKSASPLTSVN